MKPKKYSFCESVFAPPKGWWHIRELTEAGQKLGGGIDTPGLCGRPDLKFGGWDLAVELSEFHLNNNACKACLEEYLRRVHYDGKI